MPLSADGGETQRQLTGIWFSKVEEVAVTVPAQSRDQNIISSVTRKTENQET